MTRPRGAGAQRYDRPPREASDVKFEAVRVRLLSNFLVSVGARIVDEGGWRLKKAASLIKLLALAPGHRLHRELAIDLLWPGLDPKAATNNLHHALHVARRTLEPTSPAARSYLRLRDERISLCPDSELWVDVEAFEDAAAAARRAREPAAYRVALDLYAGDLLPEDLYEEWTEPRRSELRRLYLALLIEVADLYEERAQTGLAIEALGRVVAEEPTHEGARAALMRLYARSGSRGEALRQYEELREALRREVGAEPGAGSRYLYEEILAGRLPAAKPPSARSSDEPSHESSASPLHNLPIQRTSFVGREKELVELKRELAMTRLLTLTGTGGSGKTRLALEAARDLAGAYPDGAWLVELAPLAEPQLVPQAVAETLGVREQPNRPLVETLEEALREKELLLVLDNCEHLIDAAAHLVDALLSSCPKVRVLATSREALGVAGELNRQVPPLALPDPGRPLTIEELEGYASAWLFVERALYRPSAFVLTPQNARVVAEICRALDGIPLAIELAAARVGALAVEQISERLSDSLNLLTGGHRTATPRQRTLKGSLDWSYELLDEPEKKLFGRLSVFAGGWTLEAAEAVGAGDDIEEGVYGRVYGRVSNPPLQPLQPLQNPPVLDLLSRLVEKSLVVSETRGPRYRLLEPVRQYAQVKLEESGEAGTVRRRHAEFCLAFAERADAGLRGPQGAAWVERLEAEHPNMRAALAWSLEVQPETALRLAAALGQFWWAHGHMNEGRRWLEAALEKTSAHESVARASALRLAGVLSEERGLYERAAQLYEEGLALSRRLGDRQGVAASLNSLGALTYVTGDPERAVALTEESLAIRRELGDERGVAISLNNLGEMVRTAGNLARAQTLLEESLQIARRMGDETGATIPLLNLGTLAVEQGEPVRARALLLDALRALQQLGDEDGAVECLEALAGAAGMQGEGIRAAKLLGAAEAAREKLGATIRPAERGRYEQFVTLSRRGLDEGPWTAAWVAGRAMSLEEATDYALSPEAGPPSVGRDTPPEPETRRPSHSLTRREREIAALVARGLTNRQISTELTISERTVDNHVANILKKLGLHSRAQVAAYRPPNPFDLNPE